MRLSPVLVAALAVSSASFGLSHPANGQTSDENQPDGERVELQNPGGSARAVEKLQSEAIFDSSVLGSSQVDSGAAVAKAEKEPSKPATGSPQASLEPEISETSKKKKPRASTHLGETSAIASAMETPQAPTVEAKVAPAIASLPHAFALPADVASKGGIENLPHNEPAPSAEPAASIAATANSEIKNLPHNEPEPVAPIAPTAAGEIKNLPDNEPVASIAPTADGNRLENLPHSQLVAASSPQSLAQASETPPANPQPAPPQTPPDAGAPPQGTPAPTQETPDRIQLELGPTPSPPRIELNIPQGEPTPPPVTPPNPESTPAPDIQARVLVAEVVVRGAEGDLQNVVYEAISTQPGRTTTRTQLQEDINAVFATGFFSQVRVEPQDTPLGVRITFVVEPNPVLRSIQTEGAQVLPANVINEFFSEQYGQILNFRQLQEGIKRLNRWYQERGYVLAQVVDSRVAPDGTVTLVVAEGVIEDIQVRFINKEGEATNERGEPIQGSTRSYIITREIALKRGQVFNRTQIQRDLQRVFGLGLFEDVQLSLNPGQNPRQVIVQVNVRERNSGSIAAGAGFSSASGLFGSVSYQQQNLGGNNQKVGAEVQLGQRELLFDARFTDPWIGGDPYRTSYTVNFFRRRSISLIFDGGEREVELPNGDRPRVLRLGGGVTFTRPLSRNPLETTPWQASLGLQYQRVSVKDRDGDISPEDEFGNDLSFSGEGFDDLLTVQFGVVNDRRNDRLRPTAGSLLRLGVEQSLPLGQGNIFLTRLRGSYSYYVPVRFTNFTQGPQALAFNLQAGTALFDLPPYEAFSLGGSNSVRGFEEGDLGSGRSFFQATAEYRFPLFSFIGGAVFADFGTDFGTAGDVPGRPAEVRRKPGTGYGYGIGVRIQSPLGPIRIDYGINDEGDSRVHFGIGERF